MLRVRVFDWYRRFKEGGNDIYDDVRSGRLVIYGIYENIERVRNLVCLDSRIMVRKMVEKLNLDEEIDLF